MDEKDEIITATLSLTRHQWECIIHHIMNDAAMFELALCAQAGREAANRVVSTAIVMSNKINDATGVNVDLSEWKSIYEEKK
jgi:hypothetical protein